MTAWQGDNIWPLRDERHFSGVEGGRVVRCFRDRANDVDAAFRAAAARAADAEAVIDGDRRITYAALDGRVGRVAANLAGLGVGPGDRVAVSLLNRVELIEAVLACARLGAIAVPMNVRMRRPEMAYVLAHCGARVLIHEAGESGQVPPPAEVPALRQRLACGGAAPGAAPFESLRATAPPPPRAQIDSEDTFVLLYTSGTTGRPKGARLTHLGVTHAMLHWRYCLGLNEGERTVLTVPASHVTGLVGVVLPVIALAGCLVLMRAFKARDFLARAAAERCSHAVMVPAMYKLCLMEPEFDSFDLAAWRIGVYGGAPMPEATIHELAERLPALGISNGYGATETSTVVTLMPLGHTPGRADSVGRAVPCCDIRIVDEAGHQMGPGEAGEIWIAGPTVIPAYWDDAAANAENFAGGFWKSGDIGALDAAGYLRLFDRRKDMINRAGYKVYSLEVENVLAFHPDVAEAAVVGRPDPVLGERVHAFVVPAGKSVDPAALAAYCAERLSDYKVPEGFTCLGDGLPRNANGKVQKPLLRELLANGDG